MHPFVWLVPTTTPGSAVLLCALLYPGLTTVLRSHTHPMIGLIHPQVACELLSGSRTSRLITQLVLPQRIVSARY